MNLWDFSHFCDSEQTREVKAISHENYASTFHLNPHRKPGPRWTISLKLRFSDHTTDFSISTTRNSKLRFSRTRTHRSLSREVPQETKHNVLIISKLFSCENRLIFFVPHFTNIDVKQQQKISSSVYLIRNIASTQGRWS